MRAKEFLSEQSVSFNITITIPNGDSNGDISVVPGVASGNNATIAAPKGTDLPEAPVYVSPLQQELELKKQQGGKSSAVINQILQDNGADSQLDKNKNYFDLNEDFDKLQQQYDLQNNPVQE